MRQSWTDDRLDDLSHRMDERFNRVEAEIRTNHKALREEMSSLREEMSSSNAERRSEFDALHRTLIQVGGGFIAALVGVLVTQL